MTILKNEIAVLADKAIEQALINNDYQPVIELINQETQAFTISDVEELTNSLDSIGLSVADDAPDLLNSFHLVILLKLIDLPVSTLNIEHLLDLFLEKWELVEESHWDIFSQQIIFDFTLESQSRYWAVTTGTRIGDICGNKLSVLALNVGNDQCKDLLAKIEFEAAHQTNYGTFDDACYGQACFDVDGYIAFPDDIVEISKTEFGVLSKYNGKNFTFDLNDLSDPVKEALNSM